MSTTPLESAFSIIRENPSRMQLLGPRDLCLVESAERALGCSFPPSYKEFLVEFGSGAVGPTDIYGIVDDNFVSSAVPNGVWVALLERAEGGLPANLIVVGSNGYGGWYAIDTSQRDSGGESPVVEWFRDQIVETIARSFGDFLLEAAQYAIRDRGDFDER